ncbi:MAG: antibiotic biosynthesis monooxygenase [Chitinispirillaceae bacterium]|nr:antibiotic biosynthesis monooxygenase [Chitinispirillaceae bacterium]
MIVTTVLVKVVSDHVDDFIKATIANHECSVREPGNLRFDVLRNAEDPTSFMLYEAYDSSESAAAHKQTVHYAVWRDTVAPWMAEPRIGIPYQGIRP